MSVPSSPSPASPSPDGRPLTPRAGSLLLATPSLEDPNFHRSVILLLAYGEEGALGVVLNRCNGVPVRVLLPGWEDVASEPASVFIGGPVQRSSVICVARLRPEFPDGFAGCQPVDGRLATLDLNRPAEEMAPGVDRLRIFSGYAGWSAGQLENELEAGSWFVLPPDADFDDPFTPDPEDLWARILRRRGGRYALYAKAPPKLSMN